MSTEQTQSEFNITRAQELAERVLAPVLNECGIEVSFPLETAQVASVCQRLGYRCDCDFLIGLMQSQSVIVPMINGRRQWGWYELYDVVQHCESRRRYALHPAHVAKLSWLEHEQLIAEEAGRESVFADLQRYDAESLVRCMESCSVPHVRHVLAVALLCKLRSTGDAH